MTIKDGGGQFDYFLFLTPKIAHPKTQTVAYLSFYPFAYAPPLHSEIDKVSRSSNLCEVHWEKFQ